MINVASMAYPRFILVHRPLAVRRAAVARDLVVLDGELVVVHDLLSGLYVFEGYYNDLPRVRPDLDRLGIGVRTTTVVDKSTNMASPSSIDNTILVQPKQIT